jgi:hypothetical protein
VPTIVVASSLKTNSLKTKNCVSIWQLFSKKKKKAREFATRYSLNENYDEHFGTITYLILNIKKL